MRLRRGLAPLAGAAFLAALIGAAPDTGSGAGSLSTLPSGTAYVVQRTAGTSAAVALWFRAPAAGFDEAAPAPGVARLAAATIAASKPITGTPLAQAVERLGGRLAVAAYPDSVSVTALVPADRAAAVVRAMTAVYFTPVLDDAGLRVARRDVGEETLLRRFDDPNALDDALVAALFSSGPTHYGTYPTAAVLQTPLSGLQSFAARAFRPANATLVVVGPVADDVVGSAVAGPDGAKTGTEPPLAATRASQAAAPVVVPARRRGIGLGWAGPAIADEREATALDFLADYLFRDDSGTALRASTAIPSVNVEGKFVTYHDPGVFLVTVSGDGNLDAARAIVDKAVAAATVPLSEPAFERARAAFEYHLLGDTSAPAEIADTLGWYAVEGAPAYAPARFEGRYWQAVRDLTPAAVAAVAKKYLGTAPLVIDARPTAAPVPAPRPSATGGAHA